MRKSLKKSLIYLIMTMLIMPTWLVTGMLNASHAKAAGPTKLVEWNFPNNPDDAIADGGTIDNLGKSISTGGGTSSIDFVNAGSTTNSARATGWDNGLGSKYWIVNIVTTGYKNIKLSSKQKSSNTGPKDFKLQISTDGLGWSDVSGGDVTVANNYTTGVLTNLVLASTANNQPNLQIRWIMTSDLAVGGGNVGSSEASAIDDIIITADENLTAYNAAIAAVTQPNYTDASWAIYQLVVSAYPVTAASTQSEIDDATSAIIAAQDNLVTKVTANALAIEKANAEAKVPSDYTSESWDNFSVAVIHALVLPETTETEIKNKTTEIKNAIDTLVFAGQADLDVAILECNSKVEADYTPASWAIFLAERSAALSLAPIDNAEVIAKTLALNNAMGKLVFKPAPNITNETAKTIDTTTVIITWTTDHAATSRVIYDTISRDITSASYPNYGYAFSTLDNPSLTTTNHSVLLSDLKPGTVYYYRTVSQGSPITIGQEKSFKTAGTAPTTSVTKATVSEAPVVVTVAPQPAQAAEPKVEEEKTEIVEDEGVIKGDETATDEEEKINWTPWIVLFVLIVLAGAATGGYFYWFAGEDEVKSVVREPKKTTSEKVITSTKSKQSGQKPNKKSKRW